MKIALIGALCLCALVILMGVGMWFLELPRIVALILSGLYVCTGVIFGAIVFELLLED